MIKGKKKDDVVIIRIVGIVKIVVVESSRLVHCFKEFYTFLSICLPLTLKGISLIIIII